MSSLCSERLHIRVLNGLSAIQVMAYIMLKCIMFILFSVACCNEVLLHSPLSGGSALAAGGRPTASCFTRSFFLTARCPASKGHTVIWDISLFFER